MAEHTGAEHHTTHAAGEHHTSTGHQVEHVIAGEHKVARTVHQADSAVYMGEVIASGNPKRIERYFLRKLAYKLFGKFMGKTLNRI